MKILQIGKRYPPDLGGMETVMESLCRGLARQADVTVLVSHQSRKTQEEIRDGVRYFCLDKTYRIEACDSVN